MQIDVVILTALSLEYTSITDILSKKFKFKIYEGVNNNYNIYYLENQVIQRPIRVAIAPPMGMGQINAAIGTSRMLTDLHPSTTLLIGIAGCMKDRSSGKWTLGDLVVSNQIFDYELKKVKNSTVIPRWRPYTSHEALIELVRADQRSHRQSDAEWCRELIGRPGGDKDHPAIHIGNVLSGNIVLADEIKKDGIQLERPNTEALAIEMEAAGVASVLERYDHYNRFLMIKGLCDWSEGDKNDEWQGYCARASALYAAYYIEMLLPAFIKRLSPYHEEDVFKRHSDAALRCFLESRTAHVPFLKETAETILHNGVREIYDLVNLGEGELKPYSLPINPGSQFLLRAKPLFKNAKKFYVTSLDFVSTFWIDKNKSTAREYIEAQSQIEDHKNVKRLFVFSNPITAHKHLNQLDAHADVFPNTFVCSKNDYIKLISPLVIGGKSYIEKFITEDFSIASFVVDGEERFYYSGFASDKFTLELMRESPGIGDINCIKFMKMFDDLAELQPGQVSPKSRVLKWNPKLRLSKNWENTWADQLKHMFETRSFDVFHVLSFNINEPSYKKIKSRLAALKYQILEGVDGQGESLASRHNIENVWLLSRIDRELNPISDGIVGSMLHYSDAAKMQYMLLIKFANQDGLENFLKDRENTTLRFELFSLLGNEIAEFMDLMNINTPEDLQGTASPRLLYQALEKLAAHKFRRFDYRDDEAIEQIVRSTPPPF